MALTYKMGLDPFLFATGSTSRDCDKPNFVFSSDIPTKVHSIVGHYFKTHTNAKNEDIVDLADKIIEFNVNIELNTLLIRNKKLKPSDLIKENLIFLAKSSKRKDKSKPALIKEETSIAPNTTPLSRIYQAAARETFIVSVSLKLLDFIVSIQDLDNFRIDFIKDENYGLLLLCDIHLITQLETYVKRKFIQEIKHALKKHHRTLPSLTDEGSPTSNDSINTFIEGFATSNDASISDSTFGSHDDSHLGKSVLYEADFDSSYEDLGALKKKPYEFLGDLNNLRHNDDDVSDYDISDECDLDDFNRRDATKEIEASLSTINSDSDSDSEIKQNSFEVYEASKQEHGVDYSKFKDLLKINPAAQLKPSISTSSLASPVKMTREPSSNYVSPTRQTQPTTRRSSTFTFVSTEDDNKDLEYAFKATSPLVPSYIKLDKKFKFIKVGKVQKFVNLFEEKLDSAHTSRNNSRAPSPTRRR